MQGPVEPLELPATHALAVRGTVGMAELPIFFTEAFRELEDVVRDAGGRPAGPPFARFLSITAHDIEAEAVMPVAAPIPGRGRVQAIALPGGPAVQVRHIGPYSQIGPAYQAVDRWLGDHHRMRAGAPREVYLTDPGSAPDPRQWVTLVVQPIA